MPQLKSHLLPLIPTNPEKKALDEIFDLIIIQFFKFHSLVLVKLKIKCISV